MTNETLAARILKDAERAKKERDDFDRFRRAEIIKLARSLDPIRFAEDQTKNSNRTT